MYGLFDIMFVAFLLVLAFIAGYTLGTVSVLDRIHYISEEKLDARKIH